MANPYDVALGAQTFWAVCRQQICTHANSSVRLMFVQYVKDHYLTPSRREFLEFLQTALKNLARNRYCDFSDFLVTARYYSQSPQNEGGEYANLPLGMGGTLALQLPGNRAFVRWVESNHP